MARRLDNNAILSITATIVSVCALFVATYQTILMRQQQNAAVWPKLVINHGYVSNAGNDSFYRLFVRNVGIGPAIIRETRITYKGQPFSDMDGYGRFVYKTHNALDSMSFDYADLLPETVIPQGERTVLFDTYKGSSAHYFSDNIKDFRLTITYQSIYGETWHVYYPYSKPN